MEYGELTPWDERDPLVHATAELGRAAERASECVDGFSQLMRKLFDDVDGLLEMVEDDFGCPRGSSPREN